MPCWNTQRKRALERDAYQCQVCGNFPGCPYTKIQVHHIIHREHGGTDNLDNLVCLCDLCHAVCHSHMGPAWCGLSKFPPERQEEVRQGHQQTREYYLEFLHAPLKERSAIQQQLWAIWGVVDRKLKFSSLPPI